MAADLLNVKFKPSSILLNDDKVGQFSLNVRRAVDLTYVSLYESAAAQIAAEAVTMLSTIAPCADTSTEAKATSCATNFIQSFGRRAWRRPLASNEITALTATYKTAALNGGYREGIQTLIQTFLSSPNFLYHLELLPSSASASAPPASWQVSDFELAARLAFFLWNSAPDDELLNAAQTGALKSNDGLLTQAKRLIANKANMKRGLGHFASDWMDLDAIDDKALPATSITGLSAQLKTEMVAESVDFFAEVMLRDKGDIGTLLTAPWTVSSASVLKLYGINTPTPDAQGRQPLNPSQRAGLMTQSSWLFAHAHTNQTAPVLRGKWVQEALLCTPIPPPPPNVANIPAPNAGTSTRDRLNAHVNSPSCASCHQSMDGLGFAFENHDPLGAWRTMDGGKAVDASGTLTRSNATLSFNGARELATKLAASAEVQNCYGSQWTSYALAKPINGTDACVVNRVAQRAQQYGLQGIVSALTESTAFRTRKAP